MHKDENLNCKVLSVMMRHLNVLKYFLLELNIFGRGLLTFSWDFIDSDN